MPKIWSFILEEAGREGRWWMICVGGGGVEKHGLVRNDHVLCDCGSILHVVRDKSFILFLYPYYMQASLGGFGRFCGSLRHPWLLAYAISTIISCWLGCSLLIQMFKLNTFTLLAIKDSNVTGQ